MAIQTHSEQVEIIAAIQERSATQEAHDVRHRAWLQQLEPARIPKLPRVDRVLFLGTGPSEGTPDIGCLTGQCCSSCERGRHVGSLDRRRQPCIVVRIKTVDGDKHIAVDCGPGFREAALDFLPGHGVRKLDAVLLTHGHADHMCVQLPRPN